MLVTFGICFNLHFETRYLAFCNLSPPRMFLPLELLSEYRIHHGAIGPLHVTSSHSTLVSWINHLPPVCWSTFWKLTFEQQLGCRFWQRGDCKASFFCILTYVIVYVLIHHMFFRLYLYFLNNLFYFIKYSCTNGFHKRCLHTLYQ